MNIQSILSSLGLSLALTIFSLNTSGSELYQASATAPDINTFITNGTIVPGKNSALNVRPASTAIINKQAIGV